MKDVHSYSIRYFGLVVLYMLLSHFFLHHCSAGEARATNSVLLLIDVSGSMQGAKLDSVKSAAKRLVNMLLPCNTEFAVMGFCGKPQDPVRYRLGFTTNEKVLFSFIDSLAAEGGTPLAAALKTASYYVKGHQRRGASRQTIILLSDGRGDDNVRDALKELKSKKALIQCECIGYVLMFDKPAEEELNLIARETGGEYYVATNASNVIKAFFKSGIKIIIRDVPVLVHKSSGNFDFPLQKGDTYPLLVNQQWMVDSVQINVSESLFDITNMIASENMQDTLPKSIVFNSSNKVSLFINKGADGDANKKWVEGSYRFSGNALVMNVKHYYFKLVVKSIGQRSMVLCVNKYKNIGDDTGEANEEICDCSNAMTDTNPYIFIYFSQAGCGD